MINLFDSAELAQAAYANLTVGKTGLAGNQAALTDEDQADISDRQAEEFSARYPDVVSVFDDTETGFDAIVFRSAEGELVLALRGTVFGDDGDINPTDLDTFLEGTGYDQILAMYNWWQRVSAEPGTSVLQYQMATGPSVPQGAVLLSSEFVGGNNQLYTYLESTTTQAASAAEGNIYADLQAQSGSLDVTGHSLGGHLAIAFNSLFPEASGEVPTYNAPGFAGGT